MCTISHTIKLYGDHRVYVYAYAKHFVYARAQQNLCVYTVHIESIHMVVASENNDKIVLNIFNGLASFN